MFGPRQQVDVDYRGLQKLTADLEKFAKRALPFAVRNGLNDSAFEARGEWAEQAGQQMTLRNTWTTRSMQVVKASGFDVARMESRVGSTADYMGEREEGGSESASGKYGVPIPTTSAAGQGMKAAKRTRLVQRPNRLPAIHLERSARLPGRMQRNAVAIRLALASGNRYVFMNLGKRKGIFRVQGGKRGLRVRMIWDLTKRVVRTKPKPTLSHALRDLWLSNRLVRIQAAAVVAQLRRHRILGF
jgi:hypothetical protein